LPKKRPRRKKPTYNGSAIETLKGGNFDTKSSYETAYAKMLDENELVESFAYEPLLIKYRYKSRNMNYIPDFLVKFTNGSFEIHEVKPKAMLNKVRNKAKFAAARRGLIPFVLITEDDLFTP
jgi:hypothetical protein